MATEETHGWGDTPAEQYHRDTVENLKRVGCPPEFVVLYDAIPCTLTYSLAWAAIRDEWFRNPSPF